MSRTSQPDVTITVDAKHPGHRIPKDFVGLSFEANQLHSTWTGPAHSNVDELMRGLGRGNIRFSANQVDRTAWMPDPKAAVPDWANGQIITPGDLTRLGRLARASRWSVDLGVNLGQFDPAKAANEARAAKRRIGDSLRSIQIGNEPNFYILAPILQSGDRRPYTPQSYLEDSRIYRDAIRAAVPGVAIEGPDSVAAGTGSQIVDPVLKAALMRPWLEPYVEAFGAESAALNLHYYPYINLSRIGLPDPITDPFGAAPSIARLMSTQTRAKQLDLLRDFVAVARTADLAPRLTETNSVAKDGKEGVTNSFGAALWTVDYLLTAAREGVAGVNLHNQTYDCESYSLICFADKKAERHGKATVNANYYAAMMVSELAGGRILPVTSSSPNVTAYAVWKPNGTIKVVTVNLDPEFAGSVAIDVSGKDRGPARLIRLKGSDIAATSGATLAGSSVAPNGTFRPERVTKVRRRDGAYRLTADSPTAAMLTIRG